jgi:hypothetical protein
MQMAFVLPPINLKDSSQTGGNLGCRSDSIFDSARNFSKTQIIYLKNDGGSKTITFRPSGHPAKFESPFSSLLHGFLLIYFAQHSQRSAVVAILL